MYKYNTTKSANFRFYHIGSLGLRLPYVPIYAESPHLLCEHSLYYGHILQFVED